MSNPSSDGSSDYHGSGDDLQEERPLISRIVAWSRVPHTRGWRCRATVLPRVGHGLTPFANGPFFFVFPVPGVSTRCMFVLVGLLLVCSGAESILGHYRLVIGTWQHRIVVQYSTVRTVWRRFVCRPFAASCHHTHALRTSPHQTCPVLVTVRRRHSKDNSPPAEEHGPLVTVSLRDTHALSAQMYWTIDTKYNYCIQSIGGQLKSIEDMGPKIWRYGEDGEQVRHDVKVVRTSFKEKSERCRCYSGAQGVCIRS